MKTTGHITWGEDKPTLTKIYRTIIRSRMDYGPIAYCTEIANDLKKLDTLQNSAVCIASGAFRTNPIASLLNEAGEPSLEKRKQKLTHKPSK